LTDRHCRGSEAELELKLGKGTVALGAVEKLTVCPLRTDADP
jgi:hypothetical protein